MAGCSSPTDSPFDEALGSLGGIQDAERLGITFVDVAGIRHSVGYSGDGTEPVDATSQDPVHQWGLAATRLAVPMHFSSPGGPGVVEAPVMAWSIGNYATIDQTVAVFKDVPDVTEAEDTLSQQGWTQQDEVWRSTQPQTPLWEHIGVAVTDTDIHLLSLSGQVTAGPDSAGSARDDARVQALRSCLDDPHLAFISSVPDEQVTMAIAIRVDDDGQGAAWSCIHAPGQADEIAGRVRPNHPSVTLGDQQVRDDVVRTELKVADESGYLPGEASLISRAPEMPFPAF